MSAATTQTLLCSAGAKVVVAQSYARIFFRNCVATCAPDLPLFLNVTTVTGEAAMRPNRLFLPLGSSS